MRLVNIDESSLVKELKNPKFVAGYLEQILQQGSLPAFLMAIRLITSANGGMGNVASKAGLGRESMYKTLSRSGNPRFSTLSHILAELGLRFSVKLAGSSKAN